MVFPLATEKKVGFGFTGLREDISVSVKRLCNKGKFGYLNSQQDKARYFVIAPAGYFLYLAVPVLLR